jgi:hypothetical protein
MHLQNRLSDKSQHWAQPSDSSYCIFLLAGAFASGVIITLSGRAVQTVAPAIIIVLLADAISRGFVHSARPKATFVSTSLAAFLAYAAASALWAADPSRTLIRVGFAGLVAFGSVAGAALVRNYKREELVTTTISLCAGFACRLAATCAAVCMGWRQADCDR